MDGTAAAPRSAGAILARLDRLPASRSIWRLVVLLSLGGLFEFYDLFMTGYVVPGLVRAGLLANVSVGIFTGPALFVASTFAGLFVGTIGFGFVADRFGRRPVFTYALLFYCAATLVMAFQSTGAGVCVWRFVAGVGLGVELITIDTYIAELVPKGVRGRSFAFSQGIMFSAVPIVAFLSYLLVPQAPFGIDGWRWVVAIGAAGALFAWSLRQSIPESPRWLIGQGRLEEADAITTRIEERVRADLAGRPLPAPAPHPTERVEGEASFAEIWRPPYRSRTIMLMVFQFFQTFGFYGFSAWVPTLIAQQLDIKLGESLLYSFVIAIAAPFGPLLAMTFADRFERKWQIVAAAAGIGAFGMMFAAQTTIAALVVFGVLITLCNNILSNTFHGYQTELFPTRVRARAVGFTYAFSRLSTVFASFIIGFFLQVAGTMGVFGLIAFAMAMVVISIGVFGPRTNDLELEAISR